MIFAEAAKGDGKGRRRGRHVLALSSLLPLNLPFTLLP